MRGFAALTLAGLACARPAGSLETRHFTSAALGRAWSYDVYLPPAYAGSQRRYPVVFLLHGNQGLARDWTNLAHLEATVDALTRGGEIPEAIYVMPEAASTWYVDRRERMETAFLNDFLFEVDSSFRTLGTREGRLLVGVSMGGYGALRFVLLRPDLFAAAALLSPAIYDPVPPNGSQARRDGPFGSHGFDPADWRALNYPSLWDGYLRAAKPVPMYLLSGRDDELDIAGETLALDARLTRTGQPHETHLLPGGHSWTVWRDGLGGALRFLFRHSAPRTP